MRAGGGSGWGLGGSGVDGYQVVLRWAAGVARMLQVMDGIAWLDECFST